VAAKVNLEAAGFEVAIASNAQAAKRLLDKRDLVIVDYYMALDGAQLLTQLRGRVRDGQHTVFYLYTSDTSIASEYARLKFDGVFARKGSPEELVRQVQNAAKLIHMRRALHSKRSEEPLKRR
jgi:DNA-binding NarL/FixJ family response regulator